MLELLQRMKFDQQLWVRVAVFENVYKLFGTVGVAFKITAVLTAIVMTFLVRVGVASQNENRGANFGSAIM